MDTLVIRILRKRQQLKDLLRVTLDQSPTLLYLVRELKSQISFCDFMLSEIYTNQIVHKIS